MPQYGVIESEESINYDTWRAAFRYRNRHHPSRPAVGTGRGESALWTALYQLLAHTTIAPWPEAFFCASSACVITICIHKPVNIKGGGYGIYLFEQVDELLLADTTPELPSL